MIQHVTARPILFLLILLSAELLLIGCQRDQSTETSNEQRPNVIIIYADDVGYNDVGIYGAELIPTPNLDEMARSGLMMTSAYATASTCTPSRYSLLTGEYAFRNQRAQILDGDAPLLIDPETRTLPDLFKEAGYQTSIVGKWHLGLGNGDIDWNETIQPGPLELGFDESFIVPTTVDRVPTVYVNGHIVEGLNPDEDPLFVSYEENFEGEPTGLSNPEMLRYPADRQHAGSIVNRISRIGWQKGGESAMWIDIDMTREMVERGKDFMMRNKDNPFFMFFPMHQNHVPRAPNPEFIGRSGTGLRGDHVVELDWAVGQIFTALDDMDLSENTLVIFSSDNGPIYDDGYKDGAITDANGHDANGPLRGGKYTSYEGGTRLPFIVNWPGVVSEGMVSDAAFSQVDLMASLSSIIGVELPDSIGIDSMNFEETLLGKTNKSRPYVLQQGAGENYYGLRMGDWKLIPATVPPQFANMKHNSRENPISTPMPARNTMYLYNLSDDPGETTNLANEYPERVEEMTMLLDLIKNSSDRQIVSDMDI
jgi:arylsulfatase A-like enzyme